MNRPVRATDLISNGFCNDSATRERARDATFSASCSSPETSVCDPTVGEAIYVHESDGTLHPRVSSFRVRTQSGLFVVPGNFIRNTVRLLCESDAPLNQEACGSFDGKIGFLRFILLCKANE